MIYAGLLIAVLSGEYTEGQERLLAATVAYNPRLEPHPDLMASAQAVADYHARTGRWGHSSRSSRPGASENIAWNGSKSIDRIARQWKASRGHNGNWLAAWKYCGVGVSYTDGRIYAVQHFANDPKPHNAITLQGRSSYRGPSRRTGPIRRIGRAIFGRRR